MVSIYDFQAHYIKNARRTDLTPFQINLFGRLTDAFEAPPVGERFPSDQKGWWLLWPMLCLQPVNMHHQCSWCLQYHHKVHASHSHSNQKQCASKKIESIAMPQYEGQYFCLICFWHTRNQKSMFVHYLRYNDAVLKCVGYKRAWFEEQRPANQPPQ